MWRIVVLKFFYISALIANGRAKVRYPPKFELEVNVNPGELVDIHGIDTEKKHYLVKVCDFCNFCIVVEIFLIEFIIFRLNQETVFIYFLVVSLLKYLRRYGRMPILSLKTLSNEINHFINHLR